MNELMIFEGNEVEVFQFEGKVLFNPKHVCKCLEIIDANDAIRNFNEKQKVKLRNSDMGINLNRKLNNAGENFLTESGVYKLIFKSRKEEAEIFQDWITDEVLPKLRNEGSYDIVEQQIKAIEDETERNLMLTIKQYEGIVKINPTDILSGMMLNNKRNELNTYLQSKQIELIQEELNETKKRLENVCIIGDRKQFSNEVNSVARASGKEQSEIYTLVYKQLEDEYGIDLKARVENKKKKIQDERLNEGKKPLSPSTLKGKVNCLIVADEEELWNELGKCLFKIKDMLIK